MTTSFRILDQAPVYLDLLGNLAVGGWLNFYQAGTTTPQNVYSDSGLTVNIGSTVSIGTDGRTVTDVWSGVNLRVRLYKSDGTLVWDRDNVQIPGGGLTFPALVAGEFLTSDGSVLQWQKIIQVPDPSGESGKVLSSDGTNAFWLSLTLPTVGISVATNSAGGVTGKLTDATTGTTKMMVQTGSGSAPPSGINSTSATITFPTAFSVTPQVFVSLTTGSASSQGLPTCSAISKSTTTFGAFFNNPVSASAGGAITGTVTFDWVAIGPVT